jgi:broad specificity phosphatase PhoE
VPETVIHLVRHGQVENPRRVLYGRLPGFHLSTRGQAQAGLLAGHFADTPLAAVVASPLERAQQTAAPIAVAHGLEVRTDLRLIETSNIFEGVAGNVAWYIVRHPKIWWKLRSMRAPSWGERNVDMVERVHACVDAVRAEFSGRHVVLVSHQAPIWVARLAFERRRLAHWPGFRRCTLASVTTLTFDDDHLTSVTYTEPAAPALVGPAPAAPRRPTPTPTAPDPGEGVRPPATVPDSAEAVGPEPTPLSDPAPATLPDPGDAVRRDREAR